MTPRHFLDLFKLEPVQLRAIVEEARRRKAARGARPTGAPDDDAPAAGRTLAMVFQRRSTRTRLSFDAAVRQLGGQAHIVDADELQMGRGETAEDTARTLSRLVDAVLVRAESHDELKMFAHAASVPVINGLTDRSHPCQVLSDVLTFEERVAPIFGRTLAWVGDGNNVCASWIHAAALFGFTLRIACPPQYHPDLMDLAKAAERGGRIEMMADPGAAVANADAVITDTWVSMGDEDYDRRVAVFEPYQVDAALMAQAAPEAVFMHNLPAHRGEEVDDEVIDGPRSLVWDQVANRIHAQKAILLWCWGLLD
ncbi:MAG: ornithine carbamoyltransferase [Proteobacteria bacterium]|nr:ornithine carbamoyltransferase [Pseudomonadota bacterium]MBW3617719.1 ornithine carbamoyltransferase [Pseudomonadota bacterium]